MRNVFASARKHASGFCRWFALCCVTVLGMNEAVGATYYVRMDGSDTNSGMQGTASGAWRTIQKAAKSMQAGDVVRVANGTYPEIVLPTSSGTQAAPITFQADGANVAVYGFAVGKAHIVIKGFTLTGKVAAYQGAVTINTGGDYVQVVSNTFNVSNANVYQVLVYHTALNVKNAVIAGNRFVDGYSTAVSLSSGGGHLVSNNLFTSPYGGDALRVFATNVTITCNLFTNWSNVPLSGGVLNTGLRYYFTDVSSSANMDWSNVGAKRYYRLGSNYTFVATGSTPTRWGGAILSVASNRYLYPSWSGNPPLTSGQRYYFQSINLPYDRFSNVQDRITMLTGTENTWTATGTKPEKWGYAVVGYGENTVLTNGQSLHPGETYYFVSIVGDPDFNNVGASSIGTYLTGEQYSFMATQSVPNVWGDGTIALNANHTDIVQSFQDGSVGSTPPDRPARDVIFERNLVVDCIRCQLGNITDDNCFANIDRWAFRNNLFVRLSSPLFLFAPGFRFVNNTFYQCGGSVVIWRSSASGIASNLVFYNNIIAECGQDQPNTGWYGGDILANQLCDYNLVFGSVAVPAKDPNMWNAYGRELHGLNGVNPLFVNPAALDFRLQTNSPAIGAGTNLSAYFTSDYAGRTRGVKWDMGALLPVSASPPPPSPSTVQPSPPLKPRFAP